MFGIFTFPALLPDFIGRWALTNTEAGWISGIYFAGYVVAGVFLISLTDRMDAKRVYLASAVVSTLSLAGFALLADGFWSALALRAVAGVGLAGTYMPGMKALSDRISGEALSRSTSFYTSFFGIGSAASFFLSGLIAEGLGWRGTFWVAAGGAALGVALVALFLPPRAVAAAAATHGTHLLDFRPVFANRESMGYVAGYFVHNYELFGLRSWIVAYLAFSMTLGGAIVAVRDAPFLATIVLLAGTPASIIGNEISQRIGRRRVITYIMVLSAVAGVTTGLSPALPLVGLVSLLAAYNILVMGDSASLTAGAILSAPPHLRGSTIAVYSSIGFVGGFLGPVGFGLVLDLAGGRGLAAAWAWAFASLSAVLLAGPVALWFCQKPRDGNG